MNERERHAGLRRAIAAAMLLASQCVSAQGLPPIYDKARIQLAPVSKIAELPQGTFLENVAVDAKGALFVNSYLEGKMYRIDTTGRREVWTSVDGTIAGIALNPDGSALLSGWIKGKEPAVFTVDAQGRSEVLVRLSGGMFPNGMVRMASGRYLVADSYRGLIWQVDAGTKSASVWLESELLARANAADPTPAVNGLKLFGGAVYASNTARQTLIKVPVQGDRPGKAEVVRKDIGLDDFDFDVDGVLYGATHVYNSVVRIDPDGGLTVIAGLGEGMAGSTAVAVRRTSSGVNLYVVTNGGMSLPPPEGVQTGKVLRIDLPLRP